MTGQDEANSAGANEVPSGGAKSGTALESDSPRWRFAKESLPVSDQLPPPHKDLLASIRWMGWSS